MLSQLPRPILFAHRGSSAHAPENTIAAFELAVEHEADAIELDVKLTGDSHPVVIHDQTVDRTTDGSGAVSQLSLAEIREFDAGSHFDVAFKGERVPTLEEVFEAVGKRTYINIELTNYTDPNDDLPRIVVELVKRFGMERRVIFSSFNPIALFKAHRLAPDIPSGLLALPGKGGWIARSRLAFLIPHDALHPAFTDVSPELVRREHRSGRLVNAYTVNDPADIQKLLENQVDGIFTDDPVTARKVFAVV